MRIDDRFVNADFRRQCIDALFVSLVGFEIEGIGGAERGLLLGPALIQKRIQAFIGANLVVISTLRADLHIGRKILFPQRFLAASAFDPKPFGYDPAVFLRLHRFLFPLEPCHGFFPPGPPAGIPTRHLNRSCPHCGDVRLCAAGQPGT